MTRLGTLIGRHPWRWIVTWLIVMIGSFVVAVGGVSGESLFDRLHSGEPTVASESRDARDIIATYEPSLENVMFQVSGTDLSDAADVQAGAKATSGLVDIPGVAKVESPLLVPKGLSDPAAAPLLAGGKPSSGAFLTVVSFDAGLSPEALAGAKTAVEKQFDQIVAAMPGAKGSIGSYQHVIKAITGQVEKDLVRGEGIALPLTFIIMVFVFGGFVAAGLPVAGAIVSIAGALLSLFGFSHLLDLDATVINIVTLLGFGLSIDYGLLIVSRFREELSVAQAGAEHRRLSREEVIEVAARTVGTAGRTVLFSGLTVAIALSGLLVFEAEIMRAIGLAGVSVVLVAMVVAITLIPALAVVGAQRLLRQSARKQAKAAAKAGTAASGDIPDREVPDRELERGFFARLGRGVQRRPWPIIVGVSIVLVALATPTLGMKLTSSGTELLPVHNEQRVFFDTLARDYPALSAPAATVLAKTQDAAELAPFIDSLKGVDKVTSVTPRPLGSEYTALAVVVDDRPTSDAAAHVVNVARDTRTPFETWTTGQMASQQDFLDSMARGAPGAVLLVILATFVLLFLMTGSIIIPIKALILNVLSLGAALGVVVWIFQNGHLSGLLNFSSVGAVESIVPFLVLAFGFGLSMDYEVFLLSRIAEYHRAGEESDRAVLLGLQRTGKIITSAALLIIVVFSGFIAGDVLIIKQMGVALVAAVLIDATLVRMLLVPATMTVLGRLNWWAPGPLRRLHDRFGISD